MQTYTKKNREITFMHTGYCKIVKLDILVFKCNLVLWASFKPYE